MRIPGLSRLQKIATSKRFQVVSVTALLLVVSTVTYFTFYISGSADYFNNRNFRQLNSLSDQVSSRIFDLQRSFKSSVQNTMVCTEPSFKESLKSIDGTAFTEVQPQNPLGECKNPAEVTNVPCSSELLPNQGFLQLKCGYQGEVEFYAKVEFAKLINPFLDQYVSGAHRRSEHDEGFDDVLIANVKDKDGQVSSGEVIFDRGTPEVKLASLSNLALSRNPEKKLDFGSFSQATNSEEIRIGGGDYKLYSQPLQMTTTQSGSQWIIAGLVNASHFQHQTWAISYTVLVVLGFLAALVPLSWPFLKILFIGPKDRVRLSDVYFVSFSLVIGAALITLFILWGFTYNRQQRQLDDQLEQLSETIKTKTHNEIRDVLAEMESVNAIHSDPANSLEQKEQGPDQPDPHGKVVYLTPNGKQVTKVLNRLCRGTPEEQIDCLSKQKYPYFISVFWTDAAGMQQTKWLRDATPTNPHSVSARPYFYEIENGNGLKMDGKEFWISQAASSVTGEKTVIISRPITNGKSDGIIAMGTNLLSAMDAVTPPGFGYRIVDDRGDVQLQSSETPQWKENFFEECNNDRLLRSTVGAHIKRPLDVDYKGRNYAMVVAPLDHSPGWSLIVFRDKQPLRTVYLEILTVAAALLLVYALALLLVFVVFYLIKTNRNQRSQWLWPAPNMLGTYYRSILLIALLCILSIVVIFTYSGNKMFFLASLIALLGIGAFIVHLKLGWVSQTVNRVANTMKIDRSFDFSRAYIANLVLLIVLIGIIPAVGFFKVAHRQETLLFVKDNQLKLGRALTERKERINSLYSSRRQQGDPVPIEDPRVADAFISARLKNGNDVYASSFYGTTFEYADKPKPNPEAESLDGFVGYIVSQVPFYNQTSAELWGLSDNAAADRSWKWLSDSSVLWLQMPATSESTSQLLYLRTELGAGLWPAFGSGPILLLILAFVVLLSLVVYLSRFIVTKVFLLEVKGHVLWQAQFSKLERNFFVVMPSLSNGAALSNGASEHIDLKTLDIEQKLQQVRAAPNAARGAIVFENFQHTMSDGNLATETLDALDTLLSAQTRVVILSRVEPAAYYWTAGKTNVDDPGQLTIDDRWAELVGQFTKVYFHESCCTDDFENVMAGVKDRIKDDSSLSWLQKRRALRAVDIILAECIARLPLRRFGRELVRAANFDELKPAEVPRQIGNQAKLYYRRIWDSLNEEERLTLLHLAEDRLLSPNDPEIEQLFLKGLIVRSPDVRLFNTTFNDFVLRNCFTDDLASFETEAKGMSPWEKLKLPLMLAVGGVVLFLLITQRDFFGSSLSIIGSLMAAMPSFFKLLGFLQSQSAGQKVLNTVTTQ